MQMLQQIAHAKINLALQITGKREDGYHLLNSLVCFTKFGDRLSLEKSLPDLPLITLEVTGPFADALVRGDENLVMKAAQLLAAELEKYDHLVSPVKITLEKNLPIASGIGGGSADAAAAIRLLKEYWNTPVTPLDLEIICQELGADVLMCLQSKPLIAQGIGETISPLDFKDEFHIVLVNPNVAVSTPEIFKALNFDTSNKVTGLDFANLFKTRQYEQLSNNLQDVAISLHPQIDEVLACITNTNPFHFGMSGSGATCFGLYENQGAAKRALTYVKEANPQYWAIATTTIGS